MGRSGGQKNRASSRFAVTRKKARDKTAKEIAHEEALALLDINKKDIPSPNQLLKEIKELKKELSEKEIWSEDNIKKIFPEEELALIENATDFELLVFKERLTEERLWAGLISKKEIKALEKEFPEINWDDPSAYARAQEIHSLKKFLPLMRLSGQSMDSLRLQIEEQFNIDTEKLTDQEIAEIITKPAIHILKNKDNIVNKEEDRIERFNNLKMILQVVALSRQKNWTPAMEDIVRDNFSWAQEKSSVANRVVQHIPTVGDPESVIIANGSGLKFKGMLCKIPGKSGNEPILLTTPLVQDPDNPTKDPTKEYRFEELVEADKTNLQGMIKHAMVHEMIHDTQDLVHRYASIEDDDEFDLTRDWVEGLTEGLARLRTEKKDSSQENEIASDIEAYLSDYDGQVNGVYRLLKDAGVSEEDLEDRVHYLNSIPSDHAFSAVASWRNESEEETMKAFVEAVKSGSNKTD